MANFDKLLSTSIYDISRRLQDKYNEEVKIKTLDYFDTKEYDKLTTKYNKLEQQREDIWKQMRNIEDIKSKLKPSESFESKEWLRDNNYSACYNMNEPKAQAIITLHNKPVYTNIQEFVNLSSKFTNAMNLWVGTKEKRNILMSFYKLDWKSLWIDIPPEMNFSDVNIKDGKIISDTSKLLSN